MSEVKLPVPPIDQSRYANVGVIRRLGEGIARRCRRLAIEIARRMGRYDRWKRVDWVRVERLVFVCSGNICRSPYAEAIALIQGIDAVSCGTTAIGGAAADPTAIDIAMRFHVDLGSHSSRRLADVDILPSDLIVVMDIGHLDSTQVMARQTGAQLTLLGLWDRQHSVVIRDPFGQQPDEFEQCFRRINDCMDELLEARLRSRAGD